MQALPRGSRRFSGPSGRSSSGGIARSGSLDSAAKPKQQTHLELELVAIGVGLQFVELEVGRKVLLLSAGCAVRSDSVLAIFHASSLRTDSVLAIFHAYSSRLLAQLVRTEQIENLITALLH